jgi:hypothetical protein
MKKSIKLSPADRAAVQAIADQMMAMNNRNDVNANQSSTFGHLWSAIKALVLNQTGIDIGNADWNLGGNGCWADDIQAAIVRAASNEADEVVSAVLMSGEPSGLTNHPDVAGIAAHRLRDEFEIRCAATQLLRK